VVLHIGFDHKHLRGLAAVHCADPICSVGGVVAVVDNPAENDEYFVVLEDQSDIVKVVVNVSCYCPVVRSNTITQE